MPSRQKPAAPPAGAAAAALPASLEPELATLVAKPPASGRWLYEIKFDGYRMLARIGARREVRIVTRRGNDWTQRFPALAKALKDSRLPPGWYDGEIVVLDAQGLPDFNKLQNAIEGRANAEIVYYLFDAPFMDGFDLRKVAVEERRRLLGDAFDETALLRFSREIEVEEPGAVVATACKLGLEGIIAKRRGSHYVHRRSDDWLKLKCSKREEFVIGGYTWPDAARSDPGIGSLLVGQFDDEGKLQYSGKVGTGYTAASSSQLRERLDGLAQRKRPFAGATGHDTHATWVRPELVCEVTYNEWPEGGSLRHASFKGLREDKASPQVERERAAPAPRDVVKLTNPAKVIDPSTGITKRELAEYYAQVAPWMLPHLHGRHTYVARFPEGFGGVRIFQQHPDGVKGFRGTDPQLWPGHEPAIAIESARDLVAAAQMDTIEFHTWNSTAAAIALPDRVVFDLDPGERVAWDAVREGALLVKALLGELGLQSWLKTTGGRGLHLFVPLKPELDYPAVRRFSERVVRHLSRTLPERFTATSGPRNRVGRIFIDFLRNGPSQSTAEAFTARARPGMGVSMPIAWEDLPRVEGPAHWHVRNAIAHLRQRRRDPWAAYGKSRQSLRKALDLLD